MMRWLNIALRTAHIGAMGVLFGGHVFQVDSDRLLVTLWLTIGTGVVLAALESRGRILWFHQGSGILTMVKVAMLWAVPVAGDFGLPILFAVVVIGSVGSHMPGRFRHYSVVYRKVIHDVSPSGGTRESE